MDGVGSPRPSSRVKGRLCSVCVVQELDTPEQSLQPRGDNTNIYFSVTSFWAAMTRVCMQWMVIRATNTMPSTPPTRPALDMAMGMVSTPIPMLPFTRWIIVSKLEMEFSESRSSSSRGSCRGSCWVAIQLPTSTPEIEVAQILKCDCE